MKDNENQLTLLDRIDDPQHVGYVGGSDTSKAAAVDVAPLTGAMRIKVYEWASGNPYRVAYGFTADEAEINLEMKHQTCSARIRELVQLGFIVDSGRRRDTSSGRPARVYVLTSRRPS